MHGGDDHIVETRSGPVRGERKRGAFRVKGIPFAAPPDGERRFLPPQPVAPWTTVHDGTGRFPIAPQPLAGMEAAAGGAGSAQQSEGACLTLNVWTPDPGRQGLPVMFWIHGGAFVTGAGTVPWYDGSALTRRDVVVVTTNYRLGALGFLELGTVEPALRDSGNVGLLDQIAALEWVRDNIDQFGGDPGNVTIFGESAGGMSVATLLGTPRATGLFHKAIPQSGAASHVSSTEQAGARAEKLMDRLGVSDVESLRRVAPGDLVAAQADVGEGGIEAGGLPFQPVSGGEVLPTAPLDAVAGGSAAGIPLLSGTNLHEMRLFTALDPRLASTDRDRVVALADARTGGRGAELLAAYEAAGAGDPRELFESLTTDAVFRLPCIELLEAQAAHAPTYGYEFRFESTAFGGALGAAHAVEIPFVFDNLDAGGASFFTGDTTEAMRELAGSMADAWAAFAHTGVPAAAGLPAWPTYEAASRSTMVLGLDCGVEHDPGGEVRRAWTGEVSG